VEAAVIAAVVDPVLARAHPAMGETRAVVIIQDGRLVFERYAAGYSAGTRHVSWSAAKSITQALVGVAALQGRLNPDAAMGHPLWPTGQGFSTVTWRQWLQMTDGQEWLEVGSPSIITNGSAQALFGPGRLDVDRFCATRPVRAAPGASFRYNTCGITLAAGALGRLIAPQADPTARRAAMAAWMRDALFNPLGMTSAVPEFDAQGTFLGGSLVYATAQDFARFGYLYLRDGVWDGRRILPAGWVDFARSPQPAKETDTYGAGFWITPPTGDGVGWRSLIVGPGLRDAFSAQGRSGQIVLIVPSKDLVIVRLGQFAEDNAASWDGLGDWLGALARLFPDRAP
jgi:CubicO group peptidase (beta-lactamase class C family)